jgi:hypothetical protein
MEFEKSSIERLKRTLYSRNEKIVPKEKRTPVAERKSEVSTNWGTTPSFDINNENMSKHSNAFFNKFLIGSFAFFIVALAVALFIFFGGMNIISSNNLDIKIVAPSSTSSGEELLIGLSVVNSNRTDLEDVVLFIDYPIEAQSVLENKGLSREKVDIGLIRSGESKDHTIRSILYGEKEAIKSFNFRIEYKVSGSNATFSKEKTYDVIISSSPIILNVLYPKEINSGQEIVFSVDVTSNSNALIKNALVKIDYPYGFTYKSSNVKPVGDTSSQVNSSIWKIGDLQNGDKKTLSVSGILVGQNLEDRSFKISAGTQKTSTIVDFDTALATNIATIGIRKSFFNLSIVSDSVATIGSSVPVSIQWQNILPDKILNTRITATLSGNILDKSSVRVNDGGFYRSVDNMIIWDKNNTDNLISISPGDSGASSFAVASFPNSFQTWAIKNPYININVKSTGDRVGTETGVVSSDENITIKFSSNLTLTAKTFRAIGPFTNTGPIPPKADKESTYTITLTLTNTNNDLKDLVVTATLPPGVDWKNEFSPPGERLSFNPETRVLVWNVGNLSFGTGFTYSPKQISFKVGIIPSISQIGSIPELVSQLKAEATDIYTDATLKSEARSVTVQSSDPNFKNTDGIVVK